MARTFLATLAAALVIVVALAVWHGRSERRYQRCEQVVALTRAMGAGASPCAKPWP